MFNKRKNQNTKENKEEIMKEENQNIVENNETNETTVGANLFASKPTFKEKLKRFLKNKKAVAMVMEYILTIECFTMLFLLTTPAQTKATTSEVEGNNTVLSSEIEEVEEESNNTIINENNTDITEAEAEENNTDTKLQDNEEEIEDNNIEKSEDNNQNENEDKTKVRITAATNGSTYTYTDEKNITWTYTYQDGTATNLWTDSNPSGEVIIPSKVIYEEIEYPVVSIGNTAFYHCTGLTNITIPDSVTSIGISAFEGCTSLTEIVIPDSVRSIGNWAFDSCNSLIKVTIGNSVTSISYGAFRVCTKLKEINIPSGVSNIESYALAYCYALRDIYIDRSSISLQGNWNYNSGSQYIHYNTCTHTMTKNIEEGYRVEELSNNVTNGNIKCLDTYSFKVLDENDNVVTNKKVMAKMEGRSPSNYSSNELVSPNEDGIYSVKVKQDTELIIGYFNETQYYTTDENGIEWSYIYQNGEATDVKPKDRSATENLTSIIIPEYLDGLPITNIGDFAFHRCTGLTEITIPEGVTSIGISAFEGCTSLTSITIPEGVTSIGEHAFLGCSNLINIEVSENNPSYSSDDGILYNKEMTTLIQCPGGKKGKVQIIESVTSIEEGAFYNCRDLTSITIPSSVTSIGNDTFAYCTSLTSITIPEGVTNIEFDAFCGCTSLTSITIPEGVTNIESSAFCNCTSLTSITIPSSVTSIGDMAFYQCTGLTKLTIPVTASVEWSSFENVNNLEEITLTGEGEITTDFANYVWRNHSSSTLNKVTIGNGVTSIGDCAFSGYSNLRELTIPVTASVERSSFENVNNLEEITLTGEGEITQEFANRVCGYSRNNLKKVTIEEGITSIGYQAFYGCSALTEITIPEGVTSIGYYAFNGCTGLTKITIPVTASIDSNAFNNVNNIEELTLTGSGEITQNFANYVWRNYSRNTLKKVTIGERVTYLPGGVFNNCNNLTDIYFNNEESNIQINGSIDDNIYKHFSDCKHNISTDIEEGLHIGDAEGNILDEYIGCNQDYTFKVFNGDEQITDKTVTITYKPGRRYSEEVKEELTPDEETGIYTIKNVNRDILLKVGLVNGVKQEYTDSQGITWEYMFEDGRARKLRYVSGDLSNIDTLEIDRIDGRVVTSIEDGAFAVEEFKNSNIKKIILPDSVVNIGQGAFEGCTYLEEITLPEGLMFISDDSFKGCSNLSLVELPANLTVIGQGAFEGCTGLEEVVLPEGLQVISNSAFKGCESLKQVEVSDNLIGIGNEAFSGCTSLVMDMEFKEGITAIGQEAFKNCINLTGTLVLPESIVQIGDNSFSGCTGLEKVIIMPYTGEQEIYEQSIGYYQVNTPLNESDISTLTNMSSVEFTNLNIIDKNGKYINYVYIRKIKIGEGSFSGCTNLTELRIMAKADKLDSNIVTNTPSLTDIYIANTQDEMEEPLQEAEGVRIHYADDTHDIDVTAIEGTSIEVISGQTEDGKAKCQEDYKFKVNIAKGSTIKGVVVKAGNAREGKEILLPDEEGIYTIRYISHDTEIEITEGRIVEVRYVDTDGNQIAESKIIAGEEGSAYTTIAKEIENHTWNGEIPENAAGVYTAEDIVVTYVYEKIPSGIITVKYVDKDGNNIQEPEEMQGYLGYSYTIARKNIEGYKAYGVTPENSKGTYTAEDIEVVFVYEKIAEDETVVKYLDNEGNYIARDKTIVEDEYGQIEPEYIEPKDIDGYEDPEKTETEDGKEITYTYDEAKQKNKTKWTTEKTLLAIAGMIAVLALIFIVIAKRDKKEDEE